MPTSSNNVFTTSRDWMNRCKKNKYFALLLIFGMGVIFSCIPYQSIDFQILKPAQIRLGSDLEKVNIQCNYCGDSSTIQFLSKEDQQYARVSLNFIYTLKENLQTSPIFKNTNLQIISYDSILYLLKDYRNRLKENALLIVLDSIYLKDTILTQIERRPYSKTYSFGLIHKFGCRTYNFSNVQLLNNYLLEDTVFWPAESDEFTAEINKPLLSEAIWDTGIKAGEQYAHYLAPYWVEQSRQFFYGNNRFFKNSYKLLQRNQLDSALSILQGDNKESNKTLMVKKLYNQAIIYELKDDFTNSLSMVDSAYKIESKKFIKEYADKLRLRKIDKLALDWQLK